MKKNLHLCRGIAEVPLFQNQRFVFDILRANVVPPVASEKESVKKAAPEAVKEGDAESAAKKQAKAHTEGAIGALEAFANLELQRATVKKALIDSVNDPKAKQAIAEAMKHSGKDSMNTLNANVVAAIRNIDTAGFEKLYKHPLLVSVIKGASIQEIAQKKKAVDKVMRFGNNAEHFEKTIQQEAGMRRAGQKPEAYLALYAANSNSARAKIIHSASINKELAVHGIYALNQINAAKGDPTKILQALVQYEDVRLKYAQKLKAQPANGGGSGAGSGPARVASYTAEVAGKLAPSVTGAETSKPVPPGTPVIHIPEAPAGKAKKAPKKSAKAPSSPAKKPVEKAAEVSGERLDTAKLVPGSRLVVKYDIASRDASGKSLNHPQRAGTELIVVDPADKTMTGYDKKQYNYIKVKAPGATDDKAFYVARDWLRVKDVNPAAEVAAKEKPKKDESKESEGILDYEILTFESDPSSGLKSPPKKPKQPTEKDWEALGHARNMLSAKPNDVVITSEVYKLKIKNGKEIVVPADTPVRIYKIEGTGQNRRYYVETPDGEHVMIPHSASVLGSIKSGFNFASNTRKDFVEQRYKEQLSKYNDYTLRKGASMVAEDAKRERPKGQKDYAEALHVAKLKNGINVVRPDKVVGEMLPVATVGNNEVVAVLKKAGDKFYKVATVSGDIGYVAAGDIEKGHGGVFARKKEESHNTAYAAAKFPQGGGKEA